MKARFVFSTLAAVALLTVGSTIGRVARAAEATFQGTRVTVESGKSYEEVTKALASIVTKNDMMVMADVDQGGMLSMTGLKVKSHLYLIGNPNVGKQLFQENHAVGLYVPLRVSVYEGSGGKTFIEYDKPSALLSQFKDQKIGMVAQMLDPKLDGLATMAAN